MQPKWECKPDSVILFVWVTIQSLLECLVPEAQQIQPKLHYTLSFTRIYCRKISSAGVGGYTRQSIGGVAQLVCPMTA